MTRDRRLTAHNTASRNIVGAWTRRQRRTTASLLSLLGCDFGRCIICDIGSATHRARVIPTLTRITAEQQALSERGPLFALLLTTLLSPFNTRWSLKLLIATTTAGLGIRAAGVTSNTATITPHHAVHRMFTAVVTMVMAVVVMVVVVVTMMMMSGVMRSICVSVNSTVGQCR